MCRCAAEVRCPHKASELIGKRPLSRSYSELGPARRALSSACSPSPSTSRAQTLLGAILAHRSAVANVSAGVTGPPETDGDHAADSADRCEPARGNVKGRAIACRRPKDTV